MLALVLALFAVGPSTQNRTPQPLPQTDSAAEAPGRTVSPITVTGKTDKGAPVAVVIDMPSDDTARGEFVSVWPAKAYRNGTEGRVTLRCRINIHGLAEVCGVQSESPDGQGFGAAAMQLRPTFKLKPIKGPDGGPIETQVDIAVKFHPPRRELDLENLTKGDDTGGQNPFSRGDPHNNVILSDRTFIGNPLPPHTVTMLSKPVWAAAPGFDDVARAYPAKGAGAEGYAVAHCQVVAGGDLKRCVVVKETPSDVGFAKAALTLTDRFKVVPELSTPPTRAELWVDIPIRLPPPDAQTDRTIQAPHWLTDIGAAPTVFPAQAAARGVTSGVGVVDCVVGPGGVMTQCAPGPGAPDGLGFSEAVAQIASSLKVAIWSDDAGPVLGGQVRLEVRLQKDGVK
jgi:TonB family protein